MNPTTETKTETLADVLAEMELGNTGDFPFAYRVGMPDEPEVIDVTGAIIKPRAIRIKNVTVKELVDRIKAARERERGNYAAMREALEAVAELFWDMQALGRSPISNKAYAVKRKVIAALAEPPRNATGSRATTRCCTRRGSTGRVRHPGRTPTAR